MGILTDSSGFHEISLGQLVLCVNGVTTQYARSGDGRRAFPKTTGMKEVLEQLFHYKKDCRLA